MAVWGNLLWQKLTEYWVNFNIPNTWLSFKFTKIYTVCLKQEIQCNQLHTRAFLLDCGFDYKGVGGHVDSKSSALSWYWCWCWLMFDLTQSGLHLLHALTQKYQKNRGRKNCNKRKQPKGSLYEKRKKQIIYNTVNVKLFAFQPGWTFANFWKWSTKKMSCNWPSDDT